MKILKQLVNRGKKLEMIPWGGSVSDAYAKRLFRKRQIVSCFYRVNGKSILQLDIKEKGVRLFLCAICTNTALKGEKNDWKGTGSSEYATY